MSNFGYRYYCRMRPPMIGGLPSSGKIVAAEWFHERRYVPEIDCMAWGWVEYDRPLTPKDVSDYELISAPREV